MGGFVSKQMWISFFSLLIFPGDLSRIRKGENKKGRKKKTVAEEAPKPK